MAVLAAAACLPVLAPLWRARRVRDPSLAHAESPAVAIYRDQLAEVDRDLARGVIAEAEAGAARTEIARRLIHAGGEGVARDATSERPRRIAAVAAVATVAMPLAALGLYLLIGSPQYPGQPLASRADQSEDIAAMIAAVETHLAGTPGDGEGWEVIAPVYVRLGRYDDAVRAYSNAVRLLGPNADRETRLGDAIMHASGGTITAQARAAFERAVAISPDDPRPRVYLALALGQEGRKDEAIAAWQALLKDAPPDASWVSIARGELASLEGAAPSPAPGPNAEDVGAAANMAPGERQTMIEGMVAALSARLETAPGDADGWARLVRSFMVLGRPGDARDALGRARTALANDAAGLAAVEATARDAGLAE